MASQVETNSPPGTETPTIALALSGGGFRATLFHLGVIRFLYENRLLQRVTHICSVSGGSILAADLTLNWENYLDDRDSQFGAAADRLIDFIRSDARGRFTRRWLFSWLAWPRRILSRYRHGLGAVARGRVCAPFQQQEVKRPSEKGGGVRAAAPCFNTRGQPDNRASLCV